MNHVRKAIVIIDVKQLLRYTGIILKNTKTNANSSCEDCDGSCVKRRYTPMPYSPPLQPLMLTR